jgi:hypothetical protein
MKELTPKHLLCGIGLCPALFQLDDGRIVVVGSLPTLSELPQEILMRIGSGEAAVVLPPEYLEGIEL